MTSIAAVHILDKFVPELERYLLIDEIGCYLIPEGLLSYEDYLMLVNRPSKKVAVVELLQIVKRKGPDSMQRFLRALHRSCTEPSTPHEGHNHLYDLIQDSMSSAHMHSLKKQKSKSVWSLWKRNKNSKSSKDVSSLVLASTPNNGPSSSGATHAMLSLQPTRYSIISSGTSGGSDEDNNRNSIYDSTSSQDSYNPPELPPSQPPPQSTGPAQPNTTDQHVIEELQKENKELKNNLKKKAEQLEKHKAIVKEQSLWIEELKADKEKYKSKKQTLEVENLNLQVEMNEQDSHIDELEHQVRLLQLEIKKATQEKEFLKRSSTYGPSSNYKSRRTHSLSYRTSESSMFTSCTSLSSIHEIKIEELKSEVSKNDEVLHSKLGELAEMCEGVREPSGLNRKWQSDIKLVQHRYRDNDFPFLHSQT